MLILTNQKYKNVDVSRIINLRLGMVCKKLSRAEVGGSAGCGTEEDNHLSSELKAKNVSWKLKTKPFVFGNESQKCILEIERIKTAIYLER